MSKGEETVENTTMSDASNPLEKLSSEGTESENKQGEDDTSTKATEDNDSDSTMGSPDTKKEGNSDADDTDADVDVDVDDTGSTANEDKDTRTQEEKDKEAKEKAETEKKRIEELKIKYKDWPREDIKEPHDNDVMYGRGGGTNHHAGNKRYRKMVESRKLKYVNSKRLDKPLVALEIIKEWRAQLPPGRFLKHNDKTNSWDDVGDKKAREKTSQALREKAPQIRAQQQEEQSEGTNGGDKTTRFAADTKSNKKDKVKKAILARDHSLGREYLASDEKVDLKGFTWQDPFKREGSKDASAGSSDSSQAAAHVLPPGRESSVGSCGSFFSQFGPGQQPSVPDFYGRASFADTRREFSNSSLASFNQPYMPAPPGAAQHQRSGSWTHPPPQPPMPPHGMHHRSGSWNTGGGGREHSFTMNPLAYTNTSQPAPTGAFDHRSGSWGAYPPGPPPYPPGQPPYPPPPPGAYGQFAYQSGSSMGTIGSVGSPHVGPYRHVPSPSHGNTPSPPYDAGIAKTWSSGGAAHPPGPFGHSQYGEPQPAHGAHSSPQRGAGPNGHLPRPGMVKRDTSNQNESYETKPSRLKKAALNRDQSATSNRLKQQYIPEALNRDMQSLHERTGQIRLNNNSPVSENSNISPPKPKPLDLGARQSTVEAMEHAMSDFLLNESPPQPTRLNQGDRENTMDQLGYDLIGDSDSIKFLPAESLMKPKKLTTADRLTTNEFNSIINEPVGSLGKPKKLTKADRLTTTEFNEIINEPVGSLGKPKKLTKADRLTTTEFNEIINAPYPTTSGVGKTDDPLPL